MVAGLKTALDNGVLEIILDRPEKRNAISMEMWGALDHELRAANKISGLRCILLRGEGRGFSAGIDLAAFAQLKAIYGDEWLQRMRLITADIQATTICLERLEVPTVALLHGFCYGMALELALACDIRIGSTELQLALPETLLGIIPDVGGTSRLTRLIGPGRAKDMIMTGRVVDAATAERYGLLNQVVPLDGLRDAGQHWAAEVAKAAPLAVGMAKRVIDGLHDQGRGLELEGWAQSILFQSEDFGEGVRAFQEKRPPRFQGR